MIHPPRHGFSWRGEFQPSEILLKVFRISFPKLLGKNTAQPIHQKTKKKKAFTSYPSVSRVESPVDAEMVAGRGSFIPRRIRYQTPAPPSYSLL